MTEIGLGIFEDKEELVEALELFEKTKKSIQDHILDRTKVVPKKEITEIEEKFEIANELAKIIFVLDFEYQIPRKLSAKMYNFELNRLKEMQYELPDIYSFRVRFSMEEGFWIKYLVVDFPNKVQLKINKLVKLDRSIFGDLEGDKDDSASYILERAFICNEIIRPVLLSWIKEHQRADYYTATIYFLSGIKQQIKEQSDLLIGDIADRVFSNFNTLKMILDEIPSQGWILKAKEEFEKIHTKMLKNEKSLKNIDWRIAAEIILESILLLKYDIIDNKEFPNIEKRKKPMKTVSNTISTKKKKFLTDEIAKFLVKSDTLDDKKLKKELQLLIEKSFNEATVVRKEKPAIFAKNFLTRITNDLYIVPKQAKQFIKDFDIKLMYRLSPAGKKEIPYLGVDDLVIDLIKEICFKILKNRNNLERIADAPTEEAIKATVTAKNGSTDITEEEIKPIKKNLREELLEASEKELWLQIRDEYLKMLFDSDDEIIAGARILKKLSLELGLLLTEGEAKTILNQELEKMNIQITETNKEEIDANICKIIFQEIKEQRKTQK